MRKIYSWIWILVLLALPAGQRARAASPTIITATITVTNTAGTTNGQTLTVNANTRTWTNSVVVPASQILTNNSIGGCATNMFAAIADAPFTGLSLGQLTNGITLQTISPNGPLTASVSAGWATVVLTTNTLTSAQIVRVPLSVEYSTNQTNIATYLAQGLESSTYGISSNAPVLSNYVAISTVQTITGQKTLVSPIETNDTHLNSFFLRPQMTNGVNYGAAFSSPGTNPGTEQFGAGAVALGLHSYAAGFIAYAPSQSSTAIGYNAQANGVSALALGPSANAFADGGLAIGLNANAQGTNGTAVGVNSSEFQFGATALGFVSEADQTNSTALGYNSWSKHAYSTALGYNATTTGSNQLELGTTADYVAIPGGLIVGGSISNATFSGTNVFPAGSDVQFKRFALSTLANGNNAGVPVGTNIFIEVSGPTGAFTINGIAGGRDGKWIIILNRTGQNMTLANDSGTDPVAANRLYCLTGADKSITGNSAAVLIYSAAVTHWIVLNFTQ